MERKEDAQWDEASIIRQKEDKRRGISTGMNTRGKVGKRKKKIEKCVQVARFGQLLERDGNWKSKKEAGLPRQRP